jgi:signal transduction histidine kinase
VGERTPRDLLETLELLPDATIVLERDGTLVATNDRATALLGLGPAHHGEPIGDVLVLLTDEGSHCPLPPAPPRLGDRTPERRVGALVRGQTRPVVWTARLTDEHWVLSFRSAARRLAQERSQAGVLATVAHDIRSPLTSVKGFTRTLLGRWDRFSDDQKRALLETIDADADRVAHLLLVLLEVSRIDAGRLTLRTAPVDVVALVTGAVERASTGPSAGERAIELDVADVTPDVLGDAARLELVFANLLDNALRHGGGTVRVTVTASAATDRAAASEVARVAVTVSDEGEGVPDDLTDRVFDRFGRGRGSRKAGTGLGLYLSRGLVRAHGGDIELVQTPGAGASFRVTLPVAPRTSS